MQASSSTAIVSVIAFGLSLSALPFIIRLAVRVGLVDHPIHRKIHKQPVPYLGGIGIFLGLLGAIAAFLFWRRDVAAKIDQLRILSITLPAVAAAVFGLADDRFQVRARYKLAFQLLIAILFAIFGYRFQILRIPGLPPLALGVFEIPFTVFWILTVLNGMNLIDGVDGLAGTVGVSIFAMITLNAFLLNDEVAKLIGFAAFGGTCAFLMLNWRPAKLYLGDSGSTGLGMLAAAILVSLGTTSGPRILGAGQPVEPCLWHIPAVTMIALYPILEVALSVLRRAIRGKSIGSADTAHIHHKLLANGWSPESICITAGTMTIASGAILWTNLAFTRGVAAWMLLLVGGFIGVLLHYCGYLQIFHPVNIRDSRPHFLIVNHFVSLQKARLNFAKSFQELLEIINQTCVEFGVAHYALEVEGNSFEWKRPAGLQPAFLVSAAANGVLRAPSFDKVTLANSKNIATWTFLAKEMDEDIYVEHRVQLNAFMRAALWRVEYLLDRDAQAQSGTVV